MFQNLIQSTIQSILGTYIQNMQKSEFSLWGGTLELKNVVLKADEMDKLLGLGGVGLSLNSSFLDQITVSASIMDFTSKPLLIKANKFYATFNFQDPKVIRLQQQKDQEDLNQDKQSTPTSTPGSMTPTPISTNETANPSVGRIDMNPQGTEEEQESLISSITSKVVNNINIEIKKVTILIFTDKGFDLVLKIKNFVYLQNKQGYETEKDPEFKDSSFVTHTSPFQYSLLLQYINIGKLRLICYDSAVKKTNKFELFDYGNIKIFKLWPAKLYAKMLIKFPDVLKLQLNIDIYSKIALIYLIITSSVEQVLVTQPAHNIVEDMNKSETILDFNNIQIMILDKQDVQGEMDHYIDYEGTYQFNYIADVFKFKIEIYNIASILKQTFTFSKAEFKFYNKDSDRYCALLSLHTSNLFSIEIQSFYEKMEYNITANEILIRLFKLEESLNFIKRIFGASRKVLIDLINDGLTFPENIIGPRPKLAIKVNLFEILLIDEHDSTQNKLALNISNLHGYENKAINKCQLNFQSVNFKVFDQYLLRHIELRFIFDEKMQILNINRLPLEIDLNQIKYLMSLSSDIEHFLQIIGVIGDNSILPMPPQEVDQSSMLIISANQISLTVGYKEYLSQVSHSKAFDYESQADLLTYNEIFGLDITSLVLEKKPSESQFQFQVKAHLIERTTLSKMSLLDKVKVSINQDSDQTMIEANNLKINVFPESIREIKRIVDILGSEVPYNTYRFEFINKTMKNIHLIPIKKVEKDSNLEKILTIKPSFQESSVYLKYIALIQYVLRFETNSNEKAYSEHQTYDFMFDFTVIYLQFYKHHYLLGEKNFFFESLLDLDKYAQFLMFVDCSDQDIIRITFLERFSVLNMMVPSMKLKYGQESNSNDVQNVELDLTYSKLDGLKDAGMKDMISSISLSFQSIEHAKISVCNNTYSNLSTIIEDSKTDVTLPYVQYSFPIILDNNIEQTNQCELIAFIPYLSFQNQLRKAQNIKIGWQSDKYKEIGLKLEKDKNYNILFSSKLSDKSFNFQKIIETLYINVIDDDRKVKSEFFLNSLEVGPQVIALSSQQAEGTDYHQLINIQESYENIKFMKKDLLFGELSQSKQVMPLAVQFKAMIIVENMTEDKLFVQTHTLEDEAIEGIQEIKGKESCDLELERPFIHYVSVGVKLEERIVYTPKILTFKSQSHFFTLQDEKVFTFIKCEIIYKDKQTKCIISSALVISNITSFKIQSVYNNQNYDACSNNSLLRFYKNDKNELRSSDNKQQHFDQQLPYDAILMASHLFNDICVDLTISKQKEGQQMALSIKGILSNLLQFQPFDIFMQPIIPPLNEDLKYPFLTQNIPQLSAEDLANIGMKLTYDYENKQCFLLTIYDSVLQGQVVFEIWNDCSNIDLFMEVQAQKKEPQLKGGFMQQHKGKKENKSQQLRMVVNRMQRARFSQEMDVKENLLGKDIIFKFASDSYQLESQKMSLNLNPLQLQNKEFIEEIFLIKYRDKKTKSINDLPILFKFEGISTRHLLLKIGIKKQYDHTMSASHSSLEDHPQQEQSQSSLNSPPLSPTSHQQPVRLNISANMEIKISFLPYLIQKVPFEHHLCQLTLQEFGVEMESYENDKQIQIMLRHLQIINWTISQGDQAQIQQVLSIEDPLVINSNIVSLYGMLKLMQKSHDDLLCIIKELHVQMPSLIEIQVDELLIIQIQGFLAQIASINSEDESSEETPNPPQTIQQAEKKFQYLIQNFIMNEPFLLSLSLNLTQKILLQIENADIYFKEVQVRDSETKGDMGYFTNQVISHVMSNVIYSVHKIIYHSNFMGKLPSLVNEAKQSLGDSSFSKTFSFFLTNPLEMLSMFPVAAKGVFKFLYTISSSVGANIFKLVGSASDTNFESYFDQKVQLISHQLFMPSLSQLNQLQITVSTFKLISGQTSIISHFGDKVILYIDECFLDVQSSNINCHLILLTQSLMLAFESNGQLKILRFSHNNIRKFSFVLTKTQKKSELKRQSSKKYSQELDENHYAVNNEFIYLHLGLKKRTLNKINEKYFKILKSSLIIEIPRRAAEVLISELARMDLIQME